MELRLQSSHWKRRVPDWPAAAVSGFVGGAVLMMLELLWSLAIGTSPWLVSHSVAAIVMGPQTLASSAYGFDVVAVTLIVHYVLGIVFGIILGGIIATFHLDSSIVMALLTGAAFGVALYLINFYGMVHWFSWFVDMRGWAALGGHLAFGISAAAMYRQLERRTADR